MEPLHEALKKRLAQHEQMHGPAEGQQVNDHPIPGHGDGPEAGAEAQAEANRNAIALQGLDSQGGPDETGGRDDRHQMGNVEQQTIPFVPSKIIEKVVGYKQKAPEGTFC